VASPEGFKRSLQLVIVRYSLCLKINAILRSSRQTNARYKITKLPLVFCKKYLDIGLSLLYEKLLETLVLCDW
jgi:16S rRNA G1207 methylase RsmC